MHREARGRAAVWSVHDGDRTQHPCMRKRQEREDIIMGEAALGRQLVARIHQALIARRVARPFLHAVDVRRPTADDSQSAHPCGTVVSTRAGRARAHLDEVQEAGHGQRLGRGHADHQRAAILPSHKELSPIDHTRPLHRRVKLSQPTPKGGRVWYRRMMRWTRIALAVLVAAGALATPYAAGQLAQEGGAAAAQLRLRRRGPSRPETSQV